MIRPFLPRIVAGTIDAMRARMRKGWLAIALVLVACGDDGPNERLLAQGDGGGGPPGAPSCCGESTTPPGTTPPGPNGTSGPEAKCAQSSKMYGSMHVW